MSLTILKMPLNFEIIVSLSYSHYWLTVHGMAYVDEKMKWHSSIETDLVIYVDISLSISPPWNVCSLMRKQKAHEIEEFIKFVTAGRRTIQNEELSLLFHQS